MDTKGFSDGAKNFKQRYKEITDWVSKCEKELNRALDAQDRFIRSGRSTNSQAYKNLQLRVEDATNAFEAAKAEQADFLANNNISEATEKYSALAKAVSRVGAVIKPIWSVFRKLSSAIGTAAKKIVSFLNPFKKANKGFSGGIRSILKYGLGIRSLFVLFNKLRGAIKDGMENLAQFSDVTNADISAIMSSLTRLKNSLATAFAPILTVVTPILTQFIDLLSEAATHVGMLFAALSGQKTFTKAVAVQEDYAASLEKTADAAKNLSGLDEIRTYNDGKSSGEAGKASPAEMFETVEIPDFFANLAEKIKQAFGSGDLSSLGSMLADSLNNLINSIDWGKAGKTLSDKLLGLLSLISQFIVDTDWQKLGNQVADFIGAIDWSGLTSELFLAIGAVLGGIAGFLWGLISDAWSSVVGWWNETAYEDGKFTIMGLLKGIGDAIAGIGTWIYDHVFKPFIDGFCKAFGIHSPAESMVEPGKNIIFGMFEGIKNAFGNVTKWLSDLPGVFGQYFTWAFTKIRDIGLNIVRFFENSFSGRWGDAWQNISNIFQSVWDGLVDVAKTPINLIIGLINGMISGIVAGMNAIVDAVNKLSFDVPDWVPGIGGQKFGFDLKPLTAPQIPYLARGAVIPPNAPFAAVLGDQRRGTNIEAPLDTIKDAVRDVLREGDGGSGNTYRFTAQIGRRVLFDEVITEAKMRQSATGRNPFALA